MKLTRALPFLLAAPAISALVATQPVLAQSSVFSQAKVAVRPLAEDRGAAGVEMALRKLGTTARVLMIVAHPDDEDGAALTLLARGMGAQVSLLTLTRGEGGQNAMSADTYDALGVIRTAELLRAGEYYGIRQMWGREADFGFSKTMEESFGQWGHERVLYDAVLAIRQTRPQVVIATFVGGVSDGHGQHQVSGEIAQEAYKVAGDPKVFPEQLKDGVRPWQPLAVYSMHPFAEIKDGKIFDYATGKWAEASFKNYVTGEVTHGELSVDAELHVGNYDWALGRSYAQMAREGWSQQLSQNGGGNPQLGGLQSSRYHLWGFVSSVAQREGQSGWGGLFTNRRVAIDTSWSGVAGADAPPEIRAALAAIDHAAYAIESKRRPEADLETAHQVAALYKMVLDLRTLVANSTLTAAEKAEIEATIAGKIPEFELALERLLGLDLDGFVVKRAETAAAGMGGRGGSAEEMPPSVSPGDEVLVKVHLRNGLGAGEVTGLRVEGKSAGWQAVEATDKVLGKMQPGEAKEAVFRVTVPADARNEEVCYSRPTIEQPYYDLASKECELASFGPEAMVVWAELSFDGLPVRIGRVVNRMERMNGLGGLLEPVVVRPRVGVRIEGEGKILPLDGSALKLKVEVEANRTSAGDVRLKLPAGWSAEPAAASFSIAKAGERQSIEFAVRAAKDSVGAEKIGAVAVVEGKEFASGWERIGYAGVLPHEKLKAATMAVRGVAVKMAAGLKIGYVMGTGDKVPEALEAMGARVHLVSDSELATAELGQWDAIVVGIRAYTARPALAHAEARLEAYMRQGGRVVVQYQSGEFPAPVGITVTQNAEKVVDERAAVKILERGNPIMTTPNPISEADFADWVEERGHGFASHWAEGYKPLTVTADEGQDPQQGGLLEAEVGKGRYIYVAYALYRQLPELVPGAYRILANLVSGK